MLLLPLVLHLGDSTVQMIFQANSPKHSTPSLMIRALLDGSVNHFFAHNHNPLLSLKLLLVSFSTHSLIWLILLLFSSMHFLLQCNLTPVRLWCNQEEVLKLHTFRCRPLCQLDPLALAEKKGNCVPELHACEMDPNT